MSKKITIIDYGMSNLLSIRRAFEHVGAEVLIATKPEEIATTGSLVLPGVGAFYDGMKELNNRGLAESVRTHAKTGKPLLGVCLGMQMLLSKGFEIQETEGLDIIPGEILPLPEYNADGNPNEVPHVCWNQVAAQDNGTTYLKNSVPDNSYMYFVHSYYAKPAQEQHIAGTTPFNGFSFASVVNRENVWGMQFHPEKSGEMGLKLLSSFLSL